MTNTKSSRSNHFMFLGLLAVAVFGCQSAYASSVCTTATMAAYIAEGSCEIGNILFTFSSSAYSYRPGDTSVPASDVIVTPTGTGDAGDSTGFTFSTSGASWETSSNPGLADVNITFSIALIDSTNYWLKSTTLSVDPDLQNPDGYVGILAGESVQDLSKNVLPGINLTIAGNTEVESIGLGGTALSGTSNFLAKGVTVNKDLSLVVADSPNKVTVDGISEYFTYGSTPEPGPFVLTAAGIGLLLLLRWKKALLGLFGPLALLVVGAGTTHATPLCASGVLSTYIGSGYTCALGDATFSNFTYTATGNGTTAPTTSTNVVAIDEDGTVGFQVEPVWLVGGTETETITFSFEVTTASYDIIRFAASDTATANGTAKINSGSAATLKDGGSTLATEVFTCSSSLCLEGGMTELSVSPGTTLLVTDEFFMTASGGLPVTNSAHISNLTNTFEELIPEPATFILIGSALVGLAVAERRRRSRKS